VVEVVVGVAEVEGSNVEEGEGDSQDGAGSEVDPQAEDVVEEVEGEEVSEEVVLEEVVSVVGEAVVVVVASEVHSIISPLVYIYFPNHITIVLIQFQTGK